LALEQLRERRSVRGALADRLVEEDDAADVVAGALRREQQVAVGAAVLLGRLDADLVEALLDRAVAFVGGEDALAGRDKGAGCLCKFVCHDGIIPRLRRGCATEFRPAEAPAPRRGGSAPS